MNLQNLFNALENVDPEIYDRVKHVSRRQLFSFGKKAALVAAPLAVASSINKAYGQSMPDRTVEVLKFALVLEYLEDEFYRVGLNTPGLIPGQDRPIFAQISKHEASHVALLRTALGAAADPKPNFDFTAKGAFPTVFSNYQTFTALAQAFEDTGVRAYKGQVANIGQDPVLETALRIHSVEARHAARVRVLRGMKGWISGMEGFPGAVYAGEQATREREVDVPGISGVSAMGVTEAFDEPLTKDQVLAIALQFVR
ncbi:ferritin-like domain-containing protein [Rudanella lutea]|uniref:ferritin-like domain-containing protein n=1 Tax=Rudanella lutea TaxID=451374 RepID=UPI0003773C8F|nr:ferritin-like domain-containing protein [Rudanella lutea]